jgi:signal transduction histidine kinase
VHDTGYGIPAQELPYIFERFHRIEKSKNKAFGTGLGLAITKALVEEHGGGIAVESIEGKGSVFTVSLPFS